MDDGPPRLVVPALARVDLGVATKQLPHPLQLGSSRITRREYIGVQVVDHDGLIGKAYCLSRDAPLAEVIERLLAPALPQEGGMTVTEVWDQLLRATALIGRVGLVRRALGLVEIALTDLAAQRITEPLWKVLGTGSLPRPTIMVASYPTTGRSARELADEVVTAAEQGWPLLKISRSHDAALMRDLLEILGHELPPTADLVIDVGFGWRTAAEGLQEYKRWGSPALAWLEDPFLPEEVAIYKEFCDAIDLRIGVGDEVTDPTLLARLGTAGAAVIRLDVVAIGGIGPALDVVAQTRSAGLEVSTHVYPEASVHLGTMVETFARSGSSRGRYDPASSLIRGGPAFHDGHATPPHLPGLGFDLDWSAFESQPPVPICYSIST